MADDLTPTIEDRVALLEGAYRSLVGDLAMIKSKLAGIRRDLGPEGGVNTSVNLAARVKALEGGRWRLDEAEACVDKLAKFANAMGEIWGD